MTALPRPLTELQSQSGPVWAAKGTIRACEEGKLSSSHDFASHFLCGFAESLMLSGLQFSHL